MGERPDVAERRQILAAAARSSSDSSTSCARVRRTLAQFSAADLEEKLRAVHEASAELGAPSARGDVVRQVLI